MLQPLDRLLARTENASVQPKAIADHLSRGTKLLMTIDLCCPLRAYPGLAVACPIEYLCRLRPPTSSRVAARGCLAGLGAVLYRQQWCPLLLLLQPLVLHEKAHAVTAAAALIGQYPQCRGGYEGSAGLDPPDAGRHQAGLAEDGLGYLFAGYQA